MELTVHEPRGPKAREALACRVAELHGEAVLAYIKGLPISRAEKRSLWQSVVSGGAGAE